MTRRATVASYTNRGGQTFHLHRGVTKNGKPRYFVAKTIREGALSEVPAGFEFTESVNGVVSLRRTDVKPGPITAAELAVVERELRRHPHLERYRVEAKRKMVIIHEPRGPSRDELAERAAVLRVPLAALERAIGIETYSPVMRFVARREGGYQVERMTYRQAGGWSHGLDQGALDELARRYVRLVGTDALFDRV